MSKERTQQRPPTGDDERPNGEERLQANSPVESDQQPDGGQEQDVKEVLVGEATFWKLAHDIEDYLDSPNSPNKPDIRNYDLASWIKYVINLYSTPVDKNDAQAQARMRQQRGYAGGTFNFIMSQEPLDGKLRRELEVFAQTMSSIPTNLNFIRVILQDSVIDKLSPAALKQIFTNATNNIKAVGDAEIGYLYGKSMDGLPSQQGLWDFEQFKSFMAQMSDEKKSALVDTIFERIVDTKNYDYRQDPRYDESFLPASTLTLFLARMVSREIEMRRQLDSIPKIIVAALKKSTSIGSLKQVLLLELNRPPELLQKITADALEKSVSLGEFWSELRGRLKGKYSEGLVKSYVSYLENVFINPRRVGEVELFSLFRDAFWGDIVPQADKDRFRALLVEKYDQERVDEELEERWWPKRGVKK